MQKNNVIPFKKEDKGKTVPCFHKETGEFFIASKVGTTPYWLCKNSQGKILPFNNNVLHFLTGAKLNAD